MGVSVPLNQAPLVSTQFPLLKKERFQLSTGARIWLFA